MNSQDSQVLQQRNTATKRPRDAEGEVDGPPPKKANVEHDTMDGYRRKQADLSECCTIEAIFRTGRGGTLLKAQSDGEVKLSVDFTGSDPNNQASVFYLEACKGIAGHVLRCSLKDVNYYLRVYSKGRVKLRRLEDFPTKNKYFFCIQPVGRIVGCPVSFQSLNTDEYLCCDEDGNAFMEKVKTDSKRKSKDQRAWFCCQNPATVQSQKEQDLVDGVTEGSENGNSESSVEGQPDVLEEENSKDPEEGGYQYPVHIHTDDEWGAGIDANVAITIFGEDGDSGEKTLDNSNNNFERGGKDSFTVTCGTYLGPLTQIKIDHDNSGLWAAWFLDKVSVQDPTTGEEVNFPCRQWFFISDDDGKISRVLNRDDDKGEVDMVDGPLAKDEYDAVDGPKADFSECCSVQAIIRTGRMTRGESDGNLLKGPSDGEIKLSVDFTGTDPDNQASVFYLEARDGTAGFVLRYSLKDENYYLRVYSNSKVKLRKLDNFPTNNKYLFRIQRSGRSVRCPVSFKSLNTDEFFCCDEHGNAFMEKVKTDSKGNPKDIQALFRVHTTRQKNELVSQLEKCQAAVQYKNDQDIVDGGVEDSENKNSEAPGKGHPDVLEEGNSKDQEEGAVA